MWWFYVGCFFYVVVEGFLAYIIIKDKHSTREDVELIISVSLIAGIPLLIILWPIIVPMIIGTIWSLHKTQRLNYRRKNRGKQTARKG